MNTPNLKDFEEKCRRVRGYLESNGYDTMILGRRDNFAWFTYGGDNKIFRTSDIGFGLLVITREKVTLVAHIMDAARITDDELPGLPVEVEAIKWFEPSREETAMRIAEGRVVSDYPIEGADARLKDIVALHTPYTPWEVERYAEIGALSDAQYLEIAQAIRPGMTELEVEALMLEVFGREAMMPKVLLVGSDERIAKYRHPSASGKKIEKLVLIHAAPDKMGMHSIITRMLYFGDTLPEDLAYRYDLCNRLQASTFSMMKPGNLHLPILEERKKILAEEGLSGEYELHFPGCTTGYYVGDNIPILGNEPIIDTMCYDWFITITGAKIEELSMATPEGGKLLSTGGGWPTTEYKVGNYTCRLPAIMMR